MRVEPSVSSPFRHWPGTGDGARQGVEPGRALRGISQSLAVWMTGGLQLEHVLWFQWSCGPQVIGLSEQRQRSRNKGDLGEGGHLFYVPRGLGMTADPPVPQEDRANTELGTTGFEEPSSLPLGTRV